MWPHPVINQPIYKNSSIKVFNTLKSTKKFADSCLSLPVHSGMGKKEVEYINGKWWSSNGTRPMYYVWIL